MRKTLCILIGLLLAFRVSAGIVLWSDSEAFYYWTGLWEKDGVIGGMAHFEWDLRAFYDANAYCDAYAYCEFYIHPRTEIAYQSEWRLAARGTNALLMNEGDSVDHSTTFGTDKTYYYAELQEGRTERPLYLEYNEPVLLGFATVNDGDKAYGEYIYGWIRLIYDGENLQLDSSAVAIGTDVAGIYAGTGIIIPKQVPEPGTMSLFLVGVIGLMLKRRCR